MAGLTLPSPARISKSKSLVLGSTLGIAALATLALITGASLQVVLSVALLFVMCGAVFLASGRLAGILTSPVAIVTLGLVVVGTTGLIGYGGLQGAVGATSARVVLSAGEALATFQLFLFAALCVFAGGVVFMLTRRVKTSVNEVVSFHITLTPRWRTALLSATGMVLLVSIAAAGTALIHRDVYIENHVGGGGVLALIGQVATAAGVVLGFIAAASKGGPRVAALLIAVGFLVLFVGEGSRKMALLPILFALGAFIGKRSRVTVAGLVLASLASLILLRFALFVRMLPSHGLIPYLQSIPMLSTSGVAWDSALLNVLFSFGIVGASAFQVGSLDPAWFWTSITPIDGLAAGWYEIAANLRLNVYTPYAAVGELANYGAVYFASYFIIAGLLLGYMDLVVRRLTAAGYSVLALVPVGLSGLFLLYSIQYNLRSSTRFLLYGAIAAAAIHFLTLNRMKKSVRRQPSTSAGQVAIDRPLAR